MARIRSSTALDKLNQRLTGMKGIAADLDLGNDITVVRVTTERDKTQALLERYNALANELGAIGTALTESEKGVTALASKILSSVRVKYGPDSAEYERVGGIRQSERKRTTRRPAGAPPA